MSAVWNLDGRWRWAFYIDQIPKPRKAPGRSWSTLVYRNKELNICYLGRNYIPQRISAAFQLLLGHYDLHRELTLVNDANDQLTHS
jgi:hypothetical protein